MSEAESYSRLAAVYDELVVDDAYPQWATFLHGLWRHDESGVRDILDVCCGTGLMAAELAGLGYRVVGTDASVEMLERARELLGPDAELWAMALPDLPVGTTFDAVISTFDGLNYVSPDDFALSVGRLAEVVRPGGWLCFDLHTDAMMQFTMDNPEVDGEADGHSYQISTQVSRENRECVTEIVVTRNSDEESFTERHRQYFHSDVAVRSALVTAGFSGIAVFDEYTSVPAGPLTMRATWIARRA